jgi:D-3-phosphoglycerate dehydrogenase
MTRPKVLITDYTWPDTSVERRVLAGLDAEIIEAPDGDEATLIRLAAGASAIMTCFARVTPAVIAAAGDSLRVVARYGVGIDNIAVDAASAAGVPVTNVPAYCVDEVAEHVIAMVFALERGLPTYDRAVRDGDWRLRADLGTRRISGRTMVIIGGGRIGTAVADRSAALGMRVLVHHLHSGGPDDRPLADVLGEADYVSLHVPLTTDTEHLVDRDFLRAMRPDAYLINTARGAIVDTAALTEALAAGWIAGAGIDVFEPEVLPPQHPLLREPRLLATPHTAFSSIESIASLAEQAAQSVVEVLNDRTPTSVVNEHALRARRTGGQ